MLQGGLLEMLVEVATGLTPPPGVQEARAHRAFAVTLCATALDLGAGARRCFPLRVSNVRPVDAASLRYRVEALVPLWLAPWHYDLALRFPGGSAEAAGAVVVRAPGEADLARASALSVAREGETWNIQAGSAPALLRLHVGAAGVALGTAGRLSSFPLPDAEAGFAPGFVGLIRLGPGERLSLTKRHAKEPFALELRLARAEAGRPVQLSARAGAPSARFFWSLGAERGAVGSAITPTFLYPGEAAIEVVAVTPDGRAELARAALPIWQRRSYGCGLRPGAASPGLAWLLGLLLISRSWKLRRPAPGKRREVCYRAPP